MLQPQRTQRTLAFAASAFVHTLAPSILLLSIAALGFVSMSGPFWTLATAAVGGTGAAAGIALINSVGNVGGFVGPYLLGWVLDTTHFYSRSRRHRRYPDRWQRARFAGARLTAPAGLRNHAIKKKTLFPVVVSRSCSCH